MIEMRAGIAPKQSQGSTFGRTFIAEINIRRWIGDHKADMDTTPGKRGYRPAHDCVAVNQLPAPGMSSQNQGLEMGKNRAIRQPGQQGVDDLIRTDRSWCESGHAGFPVSAVPA